MKKGASLALFTTNRRSACVRKTTAMLVCSAVVASLAPLPAAAQISQVSQILSTALEPLRFSLDLLNSGSSTLLNSEDEAAAELLAGATALAAYIAEGGLLNNTLVAGGQKVLRTVAQTANNVFQNIKLQPTEDGRRRAIVFNAFEKSPLDQAIINAVGEVRDNKIGITTPDFQMLLLCLQETYYNLELLRAAVSQAAHVHIVQPNRRTRGGVPALLLSHDMTVFNDEPPFTVITVVFPAAPDCHRLPRMTSRANTLWVALQNFLFVETLFLTKILSGYTEVRLEVKAEVGSFHWTNRQQGTHHCESGSTQESVHALRRLNAALSFHGLPPLPIYPYVDPAESENSVVDVLAMKVVRGEGLPPDVRERYKDIFEPSVFKTLSLPPVPMPRVGEGLADSPWPSPHRTGFAQASSPHRGPDGKKRLVHNFLNKAVIANNPITLFYTEDQRYLWGSSWTTVFKVARGKTALRLVDYVAKPIEKVFADKFHGAYALLTREEVFVVSSGDQLEAYYDKPGTKGQQIMMHPQVFSISEELKDERNFPQRPDEVMRALCMSADGHIVWATSHARVGVVSRHVRNGGFTQALHWVMLGRSRNYAGDLEISNNMACDDANGIYVVSNKFMHRLDWDGEELHIRWEKEYSSSGNSPSSTKAVRLGAGSGSTPSLMGHGERKFVVITDDAEVMNVVVMDADNGNIKSTHPITFGDPNVKHTSSEQSVLVHGWRLAVVNNTPTRELPQAPNFIKLLGAPAHLFLLGNGNSQDLPARISETITNAWPVLVGDAPKGVQQLEFDPHDNTLRVTWVNRDVSIPNGIPTMSAASSLMYGIGKRGHFGGEAAPLRGMWTLEAIDWWTGESRYYYNIGIGPMVNSIYAATQVGPGEIITGTVGGIVRIKEL